MATYMKSMSIVSRLPRLNILTGVRPLQQIAWAASRFQEVPSLLRSPSPWQQTLTKSIKSQSSVSHTESESERTISKKFSTSLAAQFEEQDTSSELVTNINASLQTEPLSRLFAVVYVDGRQRKITTEDIIVLDKSIEADVGERILLNKVLMVGGKDFTLIGRPLLKASQVKVEATVIEKTLSNTRVFFFYIRRKDHRRMRLRKESLTYLRINSIDLAPLD